MLMRGRTILMIAAATVFLNTTACKKRVLGEPDSPAQMTQKEFEQRRHEASAFRKVDTGKKLGGPGVFVDPPLSPRVLVEVQGTAMRSTFRLDTRDLGGGTLGPPMVDNLAVYNVAHRRSGAVCEISVTDLSRKIAIHEWQYGDTPTGYRRGACGPLVPGEYEVAVLAGPATGQARFRVAENGSVQGLAWDDAVSVAEVERKLRENSRGGLQPHRRDAGACIVEGRSIAWPETTGSVVPSTKRPEVPTQ